jgi:hypothetical protein
MSCCKALTLIEGLKKGPDVNGKSKLPGNFTPGELAIADLGVTGTRKPPLE